MYFSIFQANLVGEWTKLPGRNVPHHSPINVSDIIDYMTVKNTVTVTGTFIYLFIYLIIYKVHLNAPRVVKVHHKEHQVNEPLARLL